MARIKVEGDWSHVREVATGEIVFVSWPSEPTVIAEVMALRECYRWVERANVPKGTYKVHWQYIDKQHTTPRRKTDDSDYSCPPADGGPTDESDPPSSDRARPEGTCPAGEGT